MIRLESISKSYRDVEALRDVTLQVDPGEIFGYIGPNGAGKTTSIKIITGLVRDFTGSVVIDGQGSAAETAKGRPRIGYLPQETGFQEWRTVDHVLSTFGRLSGLQGSELSRAIEHVLALTGIGEYRSRKVVHLSGGTVQKLRLAQALLGEPRIVILDEPLNGLDPASRRQVKNIIRSLAGAERVVFLSSHILSDVEDLATRIGVLHHGAIREVGTPAELRERYRIGLVVEIVAADRETRDGLHLEDACIERAVPVGETTLHLHLRHSVDIDTGFHRVLTMLSERQTRVRAVRYLEPSLEDVYLKLTGAES